MSFKSMEESFRRAERRHKLLVIVVGTIGIIVLALMIWAAIETDRACKSRGGQMRPDGTYYYINHYSDTGIVTQSVHENYSCTADWED